MIGSVPDLVVVALVGFVLFGAKNIPELGRNLGRGLREFKSGLNDLKTEIESTLEDKPRAHETVTSRATAAATSPTVASPDAATPSPQASSVTAPGPQPER